MIERKVIDKVVTFDGSQKAVEDICKLVKNSKYDIELSYISSADIFDCCNFYQYWRGTKRNEQKIIYNANGDYDSVIFHADGTINIVGMLPKCYEEQDKK